MAYTHTQEQITVYRLQTLNITTTTNKTQKEMKISFFWDDAMRRIYPLIFIFALMLFGSLPFLAWCHARMNKSYIIAGLGCFCRWMDGLSVHLKSWLPISRLICKYDGEEEEEKGNGNLERVEVVCKAEAKWKTQRMTIMMMLMMMKPLKTKS